MKSTLERLSDIFLFRTVFQKLKTINFCFFFKFDFLKFSGQNKKWRKVVFKNIYFPINSNKFFESSLHRKIDG